MVMYVPGQVWLRGGEHRWFKVSVLYMAWLRACPGSVCITHEWCTGGMRPTASTCCSGIWKPAWYGLLRWRGRCTCFKVCVALCDYFAVEKLQQGKWEGMRIGVNLRTSNRWYHASVHVHLELYGVLQIG